MPRRRDEGGEQEADLRDGALACWSWFSGERRKGAGLTTETDGAPGEAWERVRGRVRPRARPELGGVGMAQGQAQSPSGKA